MKKTVLFGAGQNGAMISRLLGTDYSILCFVDNAEKKWGTELLGIPVLSPAEGLRLNPDCCCICVLDAERSAQMENQVRSLGFEGEILKPGSLEIFDTRVATMRLIAEQIKKNSIPGDVAELGVFKGDFAVQINRAFSDRTFHLFDTFEGFDSRDIDIERAGSFSKAETGDFSDTNMEYVQRRLPYPERAVFYKGYFPDTFTGAAVETEYSFVSLDPDLYAPTASALPLFYDRLSPGGVILVHDVNSMQYTGAGKAVNEFCSEREILPFPISDLHGSVIIRK
jgi:Predicted nucleoside-diphosphate sugar epimerases